MNATGKTQVLNHTQIQQKINRLAWEVYEKCSDEKEIYVAGIEKNGVILAKRIAQLVESISPLKVHLLNVKVDKEQPLSHPAVITPDNTELKGKTVIVVDDVSNSGKTLMYAVKPFLEFSVRSILTLVLVDRDHNRYPVKTNFVGLSLATTMQEHISVSFDEKNGDTVYLD